MVSRPLLYRRWNQEQDIELEAHYIDWTSLVAQMVKRLSTMRETQVWSLGREDPLEKEMAIHSSTVAWKIPWTEELGRLQSMGSQRVGHDWATSLTNPTIVGEWWESVSIITYSGFTLIKMTQSSESMVTRLISDLLGCKVDAVFLVRFGLGTQWNQHSR